MAFAKLCVMIMDVPEDPRAIQDKLLGVCMVVSYGRMPEKPITGVLALQEMINMLNRWKANGLYPGGIETVFCGTRSAYLSVGEMEQLMGAGK